MEDDGNTKEEKEKEKKEKRKRRKIRKKRTKEKKGSEPSGSIKNKKEPQTPNDVVLDLVLRHVISFLCNESYYTHPSSKSGSDSPYHPNDNRVHDLVFRVENYNKNDSTKIWTNKSKSSESGKEWRDTRTAASLCNSHHLRRVRFFHTDVPKKQTVYTHLLPRCLSTIIFENRSNSDLLGQLKNLPPNLITLKFPRISKKEKKLAGLPPTITDLSVGDERYVDLCTCLPQTLQKLTIGSFSSRFNSPLKKLPPTLTHLVFDGCFHSAFNQPFSNLLLLPHGLTHLFLGSCYNQPFKKGDLPPTLTHLVLDSRFNQPILPHSLPEGLTHLIFTPRSIWDHDLQPESIPSTLIYLAFGCRFNRKLRPGVLTDSITHLVFGQGHGKRLCAENLPKNLTHLYVDCLFQKTLGPNSLPDTVTHLHIKTIWNTPVVTAFPPRLTHLTWKGSFENQKLVKKLLPATLKVLVLTGFESNPRIVPGFLPEGLEELVLARFFNNRSLDGSGILPSSLKRLSFGCDFDQPLDRIEFPQKQKMTHLVFGCKFNQSLSNIPLCLTHLGLGDAFSHHGSLSTVLPLLTDLKVLIYSPVADYDVAAHILPPVSVFQQHFKCPWSSRCCNQSKK